MTKLILGAIILYLLTVGGIGLYDDEGIGWAFIQALFVWIITGTILYGGYLLISGLLEVLR